MSDNRSEKPTMPPEAADDPPTDVELREKTNKARTLDDAVAEADRTLLEHRHVTGSINDAKPLPSSPDSRVDVEEGLKTFFSLLDGVDYRVGEVPAGQKFAIQTKRDTQKFPIFVGATEDQDFTFPQPVMTFDITVSPDFSYRDIPSLIHEVETLHNDFLQDTQATVSPEHQLFKSREISAVYHFWAEQLSEFAAEAGVPSEVVVQIGRYVEDLRRLGSEISDSPALDDIPPALQIDARESRERWREFIDGKTRGGNRKGGERNDAFWQKFVGKLDSIVAEKIQISLQQGLEKTVLGRAEKEILRNLDILDDFKDFSTEEEIVEAVIARFRDTTPDKWSDIESAKDQLQEARRVGDIETATRVQEQIAYTLYKIFDSQFYFNYSTQDPTPGHIKEKREISCVGHTFLFQLLWKNIVGRNVLGATTNIPQENVHELPIVCLPNNEILAVDGFLGVQKLPVEMRSGIQYPLTGNYAGQFINLYDPEKLYLASMLKIQADMYRHEGPDQDLDLAEHTILKALEYTPHEPNFQRAYALVLLEKKEYAETEKQILKALELFDFVPPNYLESFRFTYIATLCNWFENEISQEVRRELSEKIDAQFPLLIDAYPNNPAPILRYAKFQELKEDTNAAEQTYLRAIDAHQHQALPLYHYGLFLKKSNRNREALDCFQRVADIDEGYKMVQEHIASLSSES